MQIKTSILLFLLFASVPVAAQKFADSVFVFSGCKGNSVINPRTTESDLVKFFGRQNVKRETREYAEGTETYDCTIIFPGTENELVVKWKEGKIYQEPEFVDIWGKKTKWKLDNGITPGTPLAELVKLNGKDFIFSGLGWDYGGIPDFLDGKLSGGCVSIRIDGDPIGNVTQKDYKKISGDGVTVSTKDEITKKFRVHVTNILVYLSLNK